MERTLEWKKKVRSQKLVARTFMEGGRIRFIDTELWIRGWGRLLWLGAEQSVNCSAFFFPFRGTKTGRIVFTSTRKVTAAVLEYL